jgi:ribosomal protein S18 acetylase RimI-like enzyme
LFLVNTVLERAVINPAVRLTANETFDSRWFAFHCVTGPLSDLAARVRRGILQRIGSRTAYVLADLDGETAGIGLGVCERGRVGVFNMLTHPACRRQGIASAILHTLAGWGQSQGAKGMYLQVMMENGVALSVYERAGFATLYQCHYRTGQKLKNA